MFCFYKSCAQFYGPEVDDLNDMIRSAKQLAQP